MGSSLCPVVRELNTTLWSGVNRPRRGDEGGASPRRRRNRTARRTTGSAPAFPQELIMGQPLSCLLRMYQSLWPFRSLQERARSI